MTIFHLFFLLLNLFSLEHEFKMSVCEITYQAEEDTFEVKFFLFQDDLKETFYGNPEAPEIKEKDVTDYIQSKVNLRLSDKPLALHFVEMEMRDDQLQVVFHSSKVSIVDSPTVFISNELLIEKFKKQTNMVYLILPDGSKLVQILNAGKRDGKFEL